MKKTNHGGNPSKPSTALLIAVSVAFLAALAVTCRAFGEAAFAAWQTALPDEVERSLTLTQAQEQFAREMTICVIAGPVALGLFLWLGYLLWRRLALSAASNLSRG